MARVPEGAELIENPASGAPGIRIGNIFILAGIPQVAAMMLEALTGTIVGGRPMLSTTIGCWVAESEVADLLRMTEAEHEGCQIGSYPFYRDRKGGANFVIRSTDAGRLAACRADLMSRLEAAGREVAAEGI